MFYVKLLALTTGYVFVVHKISQRVTLVRYLVNTAVTFFLTLYFGWLGLIAAAAALVYPEEVKQACEFIFVTFYYFVKRLFK